MTMRYTVTESGVNFRFDLRRTSLKFLSNPETRSGGGSARALQLERILGLPARFWMIGSECH